MGRTFSIARSRHKVGGDKEKEPHEVGLVGPTEPVPKERSELVLPAFVVDPAAAAGVNDHQVVQDDQDGQEDADVVDV